MTFDEYMINPMGKKSAVMGADMREMLKYRYRKRLDNILLREHGKIDYFLFHNKRNNTYWAYFKIPSETVNKFYYDVVIKFSADEHVTASENLFKYNCQFFSNDPAFVFTYANVFMNNGLFINELKKKMSTEAIKNPPKEKNPNNVVGYVKTIFFAYYIMQERGLNKLGKFNIEAAPFNAPFILKHVEDASTKINERQEAGRHVKSKIRVDKETYNKVKAVIGSEKIANSRLAVSSSSLTKTIKPERGNVSRNITNAMVRNSKTTKKSNIIKKKK